MFVHIYLFTGIPPVSTSSTPFYLHFLPFFIFSELAFMFGTWGISAWDGRASYLSFFSMNLRALNTVLRGEQIKIPSRQREATAVFLYPVVVLDCHRVNPRRAYLGRYSGGAWAGG